MSRPLKAIMWVEIVAVCSIPPARRLGFDLALVAFAAIGALLVLWFLQAARGDRRPVTLLTVAAAGLFTESLVGMFVEIDQWGDAALRLVPAALVTVAWVKLHDPPQAWPLRRWASVPVIVVLVVIAATRPLTARYS